jgi:hypothetical protein
MISREFGGIFVTSTYLARHFADVSWNLKAIFAAKGFVGMVMI